MAISSFRSTANNILIVKLSAIGDVIHQADHLADGAQGMLGRYGVLQLAQGKQALGEDVGSAHDVGSGWGSESVST